MSRRQNKYARPVRPLSASLSSTSTDGVWVVQRINGASSTKPYICPHCGGRIPLGTPHVVAWPRVPHLGSTSPMDDRRHWHTACWERSH